MVGVWLLCSCACNKRAISQKFSKKKCLSPGGSKQNKEVGQQNLFPFSISLISLRVTRTNVGTYLQMEPMWFESRVI